MEATQVFTDCWTGKNAYYVYTGERPSGCTEKESRSGQCPASYGGMDWPCRHHAEWSRTVTKRQTVCDSPHVRPRGVDPQRQRAGCRLLGRRGGGWKSLSDGRRVSVLQDEESSGNDGDGCTAVWMCLRPPPCTSEWVRWLLCIFYHDKK